MESIAISSNRIAMPAKFRVYTRKKPFVRREIKSKQEFPKILMPEQPTGYIRQKQHDCW